MKSRDRKVTMLGVVCVLISVSIGAAFATGPQEPPVIPWSRQEIDWSTQVRTQSELGLNDQVIRLDVPEHNMTRLTVRLTWTDDEFVNPGGLRDDLLTFRVEGPSTLDEPAQTASGTGGELVLEFDLASIPTETDPARWAEFDDANASGDWAITVSVEAQGFRDTGNDWTVTFSYTYYVGRLVEIPEAG